MEAQILLADFVQTSEGKLTAVGAGWTFTGPGPSSFGVGGLIEVDWHETNQRHAFQLTLVDADGGVVADPNGMPVTMTGEFEVIPVPGHPVGIPVNQPIAVMLLGLQLTPGSQYRFVLSIDGGTRPNWSVGFNTRPVPGGPGT